MIGRAVERWIGPAPACEGEPPTGPVAAEAAGELAELMPIAAADASRWIAPLSAFGWVGASAAWGRL
ncbi:hypothetical protein [Catenulispora sp. GAS73]|uniref:hypothetical protein n=1 Tax=Catenulispora sp. GAS73 TaxID=3156269 RepID=UPI0035112C84